MPRKGALTDSMRETGKQFKRAQQEDGRATDGKTASGKQAYRQTREAEREERSREVWVVAQR